MRSSYEDPQETNKLILNDQAIKNLLNEKSRILNMATPRYLVDYEKNTATAILDSDQVNVVNRIDDLIQHRISELKDY